MKSNTTIAAISTPLGTGGIGTVRISGPDARAIGDRVFISPSGKKIADAPGYTALYGHVYQDGETVDEAVALIFAAPASYTGEDVVELSVHGGVYMVRTVLRAVLAAGAMPAGPGEFTKQAFLNHKLDLTQAEAVMQLICADGEAGRRAAYSGREGAVSKKTAEIREYLIHAAGNLAAYTDYPDEDIPELSPEALGGSIDRAADMLRELLNGYDAGKILREGIDTVIVGRPNVGKSTLMNLLAGENRSIVCDVAGTTRDIVEESVLLGDVRLRLSDTAGLRNTDDPVEAIGVSRAKEKLKNAQLVLAVLDASAPLTDEDRELLAQCKNTTALVVVNKSDLPQKLDLGEIEATGLEFVIMSAEQPDALAVLEKAVAEITGVANLSEQSALLASERQRDCAAAALSAIRDASATLRAGYTLDAVGVCLDEALAHLLSLTGERVTNAVADDVFSRFCVGK